MSFAVIFRPSMISIMLAICYFRHFFLKSPTSVAQSNAWRNDDQIRGGVGGAVGGGGGGGRQHSFVEIDPQLFFNVYSLPYTD